MNPKLLRGLISRLSYLFPALAAKWAARLFSTPREFKRPEWEKKLVEKGRVERILDRIHLVRWGDEKAPAVLLVHGWSGRGTQLGTLLDPLLALGYQVVAVDGPGHGDSDGERCSLGDFAQVLIEVVKHVGRTRSIIAHSFGASATLVALSRGVSTETAVLVVAPSEINWIFANFIRRMGLSSKAEVKFRDEMYRWTGLKMEQVNIEHLAPKIHTPALIVHDPADPDVPFQNARNFVDHWKEAKLLVINGVGHRKILKSPELVEGVSKFLGPA